jgi:MFS family permease
MPTPFSAAIADKPLRPFQWLVMGAALIVLVIEGIDLQSLPLLSPDILKEWGLDREEFGLALTAALAGMAIGSFGGGWLGDRWGRFIWRHSSSARARSLPPMPTTSPPWRWSACWAALASARAIPTRWPW